MLLRPCHKIYACKQQKQTLSCTADTGLDACMCNCCAATAVHAQGQRPHCGCTQQAAHGQSGTSDGPCDEWHTTIPTTKVSRTATTLPWRWALMYLCLQGPYVHAGPAHHAVLSLLHEPLLCSCTAAFLASKKFVQTGFGCSYCCQA